MQLLKTNQITKLLAQLIFIVLPTIAIVFFCLWHISHYFTIIQDNWFRQGIYFSIGIVLSLLIYSSRLRFSVSFLLLLLSLFIVYKIMDSLSFSEIDGFFISVQYLLFTYLFSFGWLCGWGLQRAKWFPTFLVGILLIASMILISKNGDLTVQKLIFNLLPILLYSIYILYTNASLQQTDTTQKSFFWKYSFRLFLFSILLVAFTGTLIYTMLPNIEATVAEYGGQGKDGENQMLTKQKDGTEKNKQSMEMSDKNNRNKNPEPLFCAHIDNFLPASDIANPLYLTAYHFTKFDSLTETFERDTIQEFNDEFFPDPSSIPLFSTYTDSSKLKIANGTRNKDVVQVEIYKKRLSNDAFVAPSTAFFVQPITIEKDFQKEFSSAYRSKSLVSQLNSAYFIYNTDNPSIMMFQERRFKELRGAKDYKALPEKFMKYYTDFPKYGKYKALAKLADSIQQNKKTTIDKVLAVRDYFLQKNAFGEQVYTYSDNPGIPGLPSASKLNYFLFESKKGYCAYYAGATCFLLRGMGIPSRIVTGFLTIDRSDKNPGWYWYYEDQSHAWVQVYFPEYGWIDFDTTVGNDEAERSPAPDGTPPLQPPKAIITMSGNIISIDTAQKTIELQTQTATFKDIEYKNTNTTVSLDAKIALIWRDSLALKLQELKKNDKITAVSYAEKLNAYSNEKSFDKIVNKLPKTIPIDEIYVFVAKNKTTENTPETDTNEKHSAYYYLKHLFFFLLSFVLILFSLPVLTMHYFRWQVKKTSSLKRKAFYAHRASDYFLHQLGYKKENKTDLSFAQNIDQHFNTNYANFMEKYLKSKYSTASLKEHEQEVIQRFFFPFERKIKQRIALKTRILHFLNLKEYLSYFIPLKF
ncbi:MAG: transglutaminase-like domain-containing protein [Chitinophagaceae bacterium]